MNNIRYTFLVLICVFFGTQTTQAQLFEDFDAGEKTSYAGASVTLSTGQWYFNDALLGNLSNDKYNGSQGVRMDRRDGKTGNIYMLFDKPGGADEVSFQFANYGSSSGNTLQVQYSLDGGSNWVNIGEPLVASDTLTKATLPVNVDGNIRFKFIQEAGNDRLNLDDVKVTDYVQAQEEATITVFSDDVLLDDGGLIGFASTVAGSEKSKTIKIKNIGNQILDIEGITISGDAYSISALTDSVLAYNESTSFTLTFAPTAEGSYQGSLEIASNAANTSSFSLNLAGEGLSNTAPMPIAEARKQPQGEYVTISGHFTVTDEFRGPVYFQDETGGMAWYNGPLMRDGQEFLLDAQRGDSIVITGALGSYEDLVQIVGDDVQYEVFPSSNKEITPIPITIVELNSGNYEGQLVKMEVDISGSALQGNTNYDITDNTGTGQLRISTFTNIVGSQTPAGTTTVIGVVGVYKGTYQLLPRDLDDIDAEVNEIPGEDISRDLTLDVVTWNLEWFGAAGNGPEDDSLQLVNVKTVVNTIGADIYALQEISNEASFSQLLSELEEYGGFEASFSQTQKTAILFKRSVIDSLDSGMITTGMTKEFWANGRYPLMFHFSAGFDGEVRDIYLYNIHAKATTDDPASDYNQRIRASEEMKTYLDRYNDRENVIFLGDFNDEMTTSTIEGYDSPYKNFVDDEEYTVITKSLEEKGFTSYSSYSMIDHIIISSELQDEYFEGTERIENPSYVGSYLSTTSDHFPVWTRFYYGVGVANEDLQTSPESISLNQNYPNPFNPSTVISYTLAESGKVSLDVFDVMGRKVATLVNGVQPVGKQEVTFNAASLSSGVYFYRLTTAKGQQLSRTMLLIK